MGVVGVMLQNEAYAAYVRLTLKGELIWGKAMAKIILEGGTDVAEVALFSVDALGSKFPDYEAIEALEKRNHLIKFPTGADGAYLLHLYVDEEIENEILAFCDIEDSLKGEFESPNGVIAFGGVESAFNEFELNSNIRSDSEIAEGTYDYIAYHTDYPDEYIEDAVKSELGESGLAYLSRVALIGWAGFLLGLLSLILAFLISYVFFISLATVALATFLGDKKYSGTERYKRLEETRNKVELNYPSIVVQLIKKNTHLRN